MKSISFYLGLSLQLFGMAAVGLCLFSGFQSGDYGKIELLQLVVGSGAFYVGTFLRKR